MKDFDKSKGKPRGQGANKSQTPGTDRKQAEEETARAKAYLESSLASVPDGVLLLDRQARFTYVNPVFLKWLDRKPEDFVGKTVREVSPPFMTAETTKIIAERAARRAATGEPIAGAEVELIGRGGRIIPISYSAAGIRNEKGDILGEVVFIRDITEHKRAEEALRESESKFKRLYDSNIIGVIFWDTAGNITQANSEFLRIVGYTEDDVLSGKVHWKDMTPPEYAPLDEKALKEMAATGVSTPFEKEYIRKDGSRVPVVIGAVIFKGQKDAGICFVLDISERKQAELELRKHRDHLEEMVKERTAELAQKSEILQRQAQEILEISTPVLQIWKGVVVAPLIGTLDSQRTQKFMERLLARIVETNSPVALIDITGVPTIDTQTAQHLIDTISAVRLLGAQVVLTGVRPAIAQTLVHLGVDMSEVTTRSSLASGLIVAMNSLGLELLAGKKAGTKEK